MCEISLWSVGFAIVAPSTGSASKTMRSIVPSLRCAAVTSSPATAVGAGDPDTTLSDAKRTNGPEKPLLVASSGILIQPASSGPMAIAGIGPQSVPGGGRTAGGGVGATISVAPPGTT